MPIFQYQCASCLSVFEHLLGRSDQVACLKCKSKDVMIMEDTIFAKFGGCGSSGGCGGGEGCGRNGGCGGGCGSDSKVNSKYSFSSF